MNPYRIKKNPNFVGRTHEIRQIEACVSQDSASFIIIYGRRRVGKTELIEQFFRDRRVLKFEGLEVDEPTKTDLDRSREAQLRDCRRRLARYLENPLISRVACGTWTEFFELLDETARKQDVVLYFEEVQWLAGYHSDFFAELKPFWDDRWRHNRRLTLVLCGSSPSFLIGQFTAGKALYARAQLQIYLKPFALPEIKRFLPKLGNREVMQTQLAIGGVVEYLKQLKGQGAVVPAICRKSFEPNAFFSLEFDRIFVSSLGSNRYYRRVVEALSRRRFATAKELEKACSGGGGGHFTDVLRDLEICGFISRYTPLHKDDNTSKLVRYNIADEYLRFYYNFIHPIRKRIAAGEYVGQPDRALNRTRFLQIQGLNFERWCRDHHHIFSRILGFHGVEYMAGPFFDRRSRETDKGFQIDLMYIIKGSKIVLCEIKYPGGPWDRNLLRAVEEKRDAFLRSQARYRDYSVETVLIVPECPASHRSRATFDRVITFDQIFDDRYWE